MKIQQPIRLSILNLGTSPNLVLPVIPNEIIDNILLCTSLVPDENRIIWLNASGCVINETTSKEAITKAEACLIHCLEESGAIKFTDVDVKFETSVKFLILKKVIMHQTNALDVKFKFKTDNEEIVVNKLDNKMKSLVSTIMESSSTLKDFLFNRNRLLDVS